MYHGTFCIESVPPWIVTTPPPARTYACRFANSVKLNACASRPTVEFDDDRLVLHQRRQVEERARRQGHARRGLPARARVDVRVADVDVEAVLGAELLEHRLRVHDRLVPEAARTPVHEHPVRRQRVRRRTASGSRTPGSPGRRDRAARPSRLCRVVSTVRPFSWSSNASAALMSAFREAFVSAFLSPFSPVSAAFTLLRDGFLEEVERRRRRPSSCRAPLRPRLRERAPSAPPRRPRRGTDADWRPRRRSHAPSSAARSGSRSPATLPSPPRRPSSAAR